MSPQTTTEITLRDNYRNTFFGVVTVVYMQNITIPSDVVKMILFVSLLLIAVNSVLYYFFML